MDGTSRVLPRALCTTCRDRGFCHHRLCVSMFDLGGGQNSGRSGRYFRRRNSFGVDYGTRWNSNSLYLEWSAMSGEIAIAILGLPG